MGNHEEKFRIFISYTRSDKDLVVKLAHYLEHAEFQPLWDDKFMGGEGFTPEIQKLISQSHAFIAFVTEHSNQRGWVQQEIGYALAHNIPVLPVSIGTDPVGFISGLGAVRLDRDLPASVTSGSREQLAEALSLEHLAKRLPGTTIQDLVSKAAGHEEATLCRFVWHNEARIRLLGDYAEMVRTSGHFGMVRQKTGLTSFCTMEVDPNHLYWVLRYGKEHGRADNYLELICKEHHQLCQHVQHQGCRLIIHADQDYSKYGPASKLARLAGLIKFLENPPHPDVYVALDLYPATGDSFTLVGDWFSATSVPIRVGTGHRQTVFSTHAPSARKLVESFDKEFSNLLQEQHVQERDSREYAITKLRECKEKEAQALGFDFPDNKLNRETVLPILQRLSRQTKKAHKLRSES